MQIIQVTDYGSPHAGAFVPMLATALDRVRGRDWSPMVTLPARARTRSAEWLPQFEARHGDEVRVAPQLERRAQAGWLEELIAAAPGPTILHSHMSAYDIAVAEVARRRPDVTAIWQFHTVLGDDLRARARNRLRFLLAGRYVERMICVGPALAEAIRARGAPRHKVLVLPNGLDVGAFPPVSPAERAAARDRLGIPSGSRVLLHIGRDWRLKGGDLFLDAIEDLGDPAVVGLMVRGGEDAAAEIERRGLGDRVRVLPGAPDIRRLHAVADLMVAPSRGEGTLPFAILEALSSGLSVVASDIPGHALAGPPPPGLHKVALEAVDIARTAGALLDRDPDQVRRESAASHAWVEAERSLSVWGDRLIQIYEETTGNRPS